MEELNILDVYSNLVPIIEKTSIGIPTKDPYLRIFTGAALAKCLEFNLMSFDDTHNNAAFFNTSGLRGICEDFITLKYFNEIIDPQDTQDILLTWSKKQMLEGVKKQSVFFKSNRPQQPVFTCPDSDYQSMLQSTNTTLRSYRSKYGWARNAPRIIDMADSCTLRPLYDYLYSATSKFVHFSPHFFMRMGWGDIKTTDPSFHYSTRNFARYYVDFSRFYGTFLFIKFCETFGDYLEISDELTDSLMILREYLENTPRWPESVTFEEMNLSPPNYGTIHKLTLLFKDFNDDRHELLKALLKERSNEKIRKMSVDEKRDLVNKILGGQVSDKVANIPESKLDQILHDFEEHLSQNISPDIQAEDMARFLSSIPSDDLARYLRKMATDLSAEYDGADELL